MSPVLQSRPRDSLHQSPLCHTRIRIITTADELEKMKDREWISLNPFSPLYLEMETQIKEWKKRGGRCMIGRYITCRGGVVAADELAPYLDVPSSKSDADDESYILPVLLRFDGQPVLDEEGNILYRFPFMQRTASGLGSGRHMGKWVDCVEDVEKMFKELGKMAI